MGLSMLVTFSAHIPQGFSPHRHRHINNIFLLFNFFCKFKIPPFPSVFRQLNKDSERVGRTSDTQERKSTESDTDLLPIETRIQRERERVSRTIEPQIHKKGKAQKAIQICFPSKLHRRAQNNTGLVIPVSFIYFFNYLLFGGI